MSPRSPVNSLQCNGLAGEQGITVSHAHLELTGQWRTCYWNLPQGRAICWIKLEIGYNNVELFSVPWVSCSPLPVDPKLLQCIRSRDRLLMLGMDCSSVAIWLSVDLKQEKIWHQNSDSVVHGTWKFLTGVISLAKLSDVPLCIKQELWLQQDGMHPPWDKQVYNNKLYFSVKFFKTTGLCKQQPVPWPPRSPDPTSLDHCL